MAGFSLKVRGAGPIRRYARQLRAEGKRLPGELRREAERGLAGVEREIRSRAGASVPRRYSRVLVPSLRFKRSVQLVRDGGGIRLTVWAVSPTGRRALDDLNEGRLRHPVFGDRERWYGQRVRPGMVTGPFEAGEKEVIKRLTKVRDDLRDRLARG